MIDRTVVERWLADFLKRLRKSFGERLVFVGHHGSWARGEPGAASDIDTIVILDHIDSQDLTTLGQSSRPVKSSPGINTKGVFAKVLQRR